MEVISEEEMAPLPPSPVGPRGMPAWTPLAARPHARVAPVSLCADPDPAEHDHAAYAGEEKNRGSARKLRGKVAVIDLRIASAKAEPWTPVALRHADAEAIEARAFVLREAAHHGVADLSLDIVPWFVTTSLPAVHITVDGHGRPDWGEVGVLRGRVLRDVSAATGVSVSEAVRALKKAGYDEVAVMVRLPTSQIVREFAPWSEGDGLDVAFVQLHATATEPGTYAHELLHLFGADDLYRIHPRDARDDDDVMGGACGGMLERTRIGDATAWAIGWRAQPPPRAYAIGGRRAVAARAQRPDDDGPLPESHVE